MSTNSSSKPRDWDAASYLTFADDRTRPARDLLAQIPLSSPRRVVDLGCGPGNSTSLLAARYPDSELIGVDSSSNMLDKARTALPQAQFVLDDLRSYSPPQDQQPVDLFFSNAALHWLSTGERKCVIKRLLKSQPPGGVFAFQVPDNLLEPSHQAMLEIVTDNGKDTPWQAIFKEQRLSRDSIASPLDTYNEFESLCSKVDIWHTHYQHVLENHEAIADWFRTTGLRPFLDPLADNKKLKEAFLDTYVEKLKAAYPATSDGKVLLKFPRLFVVLIRK